MNEWLQLINNQMTTIKTHDIEWKKLFNPLMLEMSLAMSKWHTSLSYRDSLTVYANNTFPADSTAGTQNF